jgi:hypothetical protein
MTQQALKEFPKNIRNKKPIILSSLPVSCKLEVFCSPNGATALW